MYCEQRQTKCSLSNLQLNKTLEIKCFLCWLLFYKLPLCLQGWGGGSPQGYVFIGVHWGESNEKSSGFTINFQHENKISMSIYNEILIALVKQSWEFYMFSLSTIFQLYLCRQFYWLRKWEYPEKTNDLPLVTDKYLSDNVVSSTRCQGHLNSIIGIYCIDISNKISV